MIELSRFHKRCSLFFICLALRYVTCVERPQTLPSGPGSPAATLRVGASRSWPQPRAEYAAIPAICRCSLEMNASIYISCGCNIGVIVLHQSFCVADETSRGCSRTLDCAAFGRVVNFSFVSFTEFGILFKLDFSELAERRPQRFFYLRCLFFELSC